MKNLWQDCWIVLPTFFFFLRSLFVLFVSSWFNDSFGRD